MLITIVELPEYIKSAEKELSKDERDELIYYLSSNPKAGTLMQGTGGVRKLRWASKGKGKSGGSRVIYFYYNETIPLFLLTIFGKNEKINLSKAERNELAKFVKELVKSYKR
ncbi:MAG: addiction module toxin RelE [Ignavibacteria bacterium CG2_30_36_16]|nr:type II toxin-antitoxin system RelE/ParE family toxin [Ignavibacteria bacterium]OIP58918.1 MAG: addiction module toxin RelE [Ignavibacteria bacterium CG2_30_36_16]PJB00854.1 MAG: addiction module toxin RelE [Ignavibacteria bacterium CG_4_9_14_3_um_filter_36_18]